MIKSKDYSGSISKIEDYLKKWNINHDAIYTLVSDGSWSFGPFGFAKREERYIRSYAPKWLFWCIDWANAKIIYHEYLHILGIKECTSFFKMFCIMYESDDFRLFEIIAKFFQILRGINPCKKCKEFQLECEKERNIGNLEDNK